MEIVYMCCGIISISLIVWFLFFASPKQENPKTKYDYTKYSNKDLDFRILDPEFEKAFIDLFISNVCLGYIEYERNPEYNSDHYHYQAEEQMIKYLRTKQPEFWRVLDERASLAFEKLRKETKNDI